MNTAQLSKNVARIFGISEELANQFLHNMDESTADIPQTFFLDFMEKIPTPTYFGIPKKPRNIPTMNFFGKPYPQHIMNSWKKNHEAQVAKYTQTMEYLAGRTTPLENEMNIEAGDYKLNENGMIIGKFPKGEFGYVKPNKSRPDKYVYKFQNVSNETLSDPRYGKSVFREALINIILQMDPRVEDSVMKIYKVYQKRSYNGYELIFKLEALGYSINIMSSFIFGDDPEKNKKVFLNLYGPFLETLRYLRETYDFQHGDLHSNNMMLPKGTDLEHLNIHAPRIHMIDFGFSGLRLGDVKYGTVYSEGKEDFQKEFEVLTVIKSLPADFNEKIRSFDVLKEEEALGLEDFVIEQSKAVSGGRRKTRKQKTKKRKTRRSRR
jgi:hypothetical protein